MDAEWMVGLLNGKVSEAKRIAGGGESVQIGHDQLGEVLPLCERELYVRGTVVRGSSGRRGEERKRKKES